VKASGWAGRAVPYVGGETLVVLELGVTIMMRPPGADVDGRGSMSRSA
jgi:hypothetical protein